MCACIYDYIAVSTIHYDSDGRGPFRDAEAVTPLPLLLWPATKPSAGAVVICMWFMHVTCKCLTLLVDTAWCCHDSLMLVQPKTHSVTVTRHV